ncbi:Polypeptide N-Acetylgalactosaminyltransferase 14 [Manis pentadactyla]|nr:Polypeptide N-Acetylgalactosaminyltransferase 14 [Manis pentadactyla]
MADATMVNISAKRYLDQCTCSYFLGEAGEAPAAAFIMAKVCKVAQCEEASEMDNSELILVDKSGKRERERCMAEQRGAGDRQGAWSPNLEATSCSKWSDGKISMFGD